MLPRSPGISQTIFQRATFPSPLQTHKKTQRCKKKISKSILEHLSISVQTKVHQPQHLVSKVSNKGLGKEHRKMTLK